MTEKAFDRARAIHSELYDLNKLEEYLYRLERKQETFVSAPSTGFQFAWRVTGRPITDDLLKEYVARGRKLLKEKRAALNKEFEEL